MFQVGDVIRQKHQAHAPSRLVVKLTDDPDIVVVHDPDENTYKRVFVWSHEPALLRVAEKHLQSEEFVATTSKVWW